jgi:interleukin-1 receptor-associated kinase 1
MLLSILFVPQAISVSFDFDFSQPSGYKAANLILQGDAQMVDKVIELTGKGLENSAGRASYSEPVAIWDESTGELASFTTVFSFQILNQPQQRRWHGFFPRALPIDHPCHKRRRRPRPVHLGHYKRNWG